MGSVVALNVQPKTMNKTYRNHQYVITFLVAERKWSWTVTYVQVSEYTGTPVDTWQKAQKAAEKHIDRTIELKGE